jgi:hypothetical protein
VVNVSSSSLSRQLHCCYDVTHVSSYAEPSIRKVLLLPLMEVKLILGKCRSPRNYS